MTRRGSFAGYLRSLNEAKYWLTMDFIIGYTLGGDNSSGRNSFHSWQKKARGDTEAVSDCKIWLILTLILICLAKKSKRFDPPVLYSTVGYSRGIRVDRN